MSGAPVQIPQPQPAPARPVIVEPKPPRRGGKWGVILLGILLVAGLGWWLYPRIASPTTTAGPAPGIRTAAVRSGVSIMRTVRLSGTTGAEKFSSLLVPRLRFSRSDRLREGTTTFKGPPATYTVQSNARPAGTVSNVSSSGQVTSTSGNQNNASRSSAFNTATSRVSRGSTNRSSTDSTATDSTSTSTAAGEGGLGSTSNTLLNGNAGGGGGNNQGGGGGGGGGGRGGGDSNMTLEKVIKPGSMVQKGALVAEFDRQFMINRLEDYQAAVAQIEASFRKLEAELEAQRKLHAKKVEDAAAELEQARLDLKTIPVLGAMDVERVKLAAEEAEAQYKQLKAEEKFVEAGYAAQRRNAELELEQARLELKRAQAVADQMLLRAPIGGLAVMQTTFRGGEFGQIQAGDQLWPGMMFMQVVDPSSMIVTAMMNQVDAESVRVGAKSTVRFDAFPGLELPAHVHAIGAMTRTGGMRGDYVKEIPVVLKLDRMDPRVIPDLSVSAEIVVAAESNLTAAPLGSVFRDQETGSPFVYVRSEQGWQRRPVELGLADNLQIAIRSGVQAGEMVALEDPFSQENRKEQS